MGGGYGPRNEGLRTAHVCLPSRESAASHLIYADVRNSDTMTSLCRYAVPAAVDILGSGKYARLPYCIIASAPQAAPTPAQAAASLEWLNHHLHLRLIEDRYGRPAAASGSLYIFAPVFYILILKRRQAFVIFLPSCFLYVDIQDCHSRRLTLPLTLPFPNPPHQPKPPTATTTTFVCSPNTAHCTLHTAWLREDCPMDWTLPG